MKSFRFSHVFSLGLIVNCLWLCPETASADTISIFSNTTNWRLSTQNPINNSVPWPGVAALPAAGTFTLIPVAGAAHVFHVPGSTNLFAGSGIRFYRTDFNLGAFSTLTADLRISVDNSVHIFINGQALALEGSLSSANFANSIHHRLFIDAAGNVTNGFMSGDSFDSFAATFPAANWNVGTNEIILAIRNLSGGDAGGFSFGLDLTTTAVVTPAPEPFAVNLLGFGVLSLFGYGWRHRKSA